MYLEKCSKTRYINWLLNFDENLAALPSANTFARSGLKWLGNSIFEGQGSFAFKTTDAGSALEDGFLEKLSIDYNHDTMLIFYIMEVSPPQKYKATPLVAKQSKTINSSQYPSSDGSFSYYKENQATVV